MKKSKKIMAAALALVLALSMIIAGTSSFTVFAAEDKGENLGLTPGRVYTLNTYYTMQVGESHTFTCQPTYNYITHFGIDNSNKNVASASKNGSHSAVVKALRPGTTVIKLNVHSEYHNIVADDLVIDVKVINITVLAKGQTPPKAGTPTNVKVRNDDNGFHLDWYKTANAASYIVYYKSTKDLEWQTKTTKNTYLWMYAEYHGELYYFQVQAVSSTGEKGGFSSPVSMTCVCRTTLYSTAYNSNGSVTVKWDSASGANGYAVAKKRSTDKNFTYYYTSSTSFNDRNVVGGAIYYYQIRPYHSNGKSAAYADKWSNSKSITTLFKPTITNMNINASRLNINWNAIKGATAYKVAFKRTTDSAWNYRTTTARYFNVVNPTKGATYVAQVCPLNGSLAGPWSDPKSATLIVLDKPVISSLGMVKKNMVVNWNKINGAVKYKVAVKAESDKNWSYEYVTINKLTKSTYNPKTRYYFQVCAVASNGTEGPYSSAASLVTP